MSRLNPRTTHNIPTGCGTTLICHGLFDNVHALTTSSTSLRTRVSSVTKPGSLERLVRALRPREALAILVS